MIHVSLAHAQRYADLHPGFREGLAFLHDFDPGTPNGRYDLPGTHGFALVQRYQTAPVAEKRMEAHRKYIDIQYLVEGQEIIHVAHPETQTVSEEYNPETDALFYEGRKDLVEIPLQAGHLVVFFPEDAHRPGCQSGGTPAPVTKVVIKIPV